MKRLIASILIATMIGAPASAQAPAKKVDAPEGFDSLTWLAGTRYIERNGFRSYETWTATGKLSPGSSPGNTERFKRGRCGHSVAPVLVRLEEKAI